MEKDQRIVLGHPALDEDHARLFDLLDRLKFAVEAKAEVRELIPVILGLENYTRQHFEHEESLMKAAAYPGLEAHRLSHQDMLNQLAVFRSMVTHAFQGSGADGIALLRGWIREHMDTVDREFAEYVSGLIPVSAGTVRE